MTIKQKLFTAILALMGLITISPSVAMAASCGGAETSIISCSQTSTGTSAKDNGIWGVLLIVLNILTGAVGIAAVGGIVYGAILYTSAADNTQQVKQAMEIIRNVVIGLVAYGLMFIGLNFLIPGGIFA